MLARYESNYRISGVTLEQAHRHLELELELTQQLLASTPENRRETFERCYGELYRQLPWLTGIGGKGNLRPWLQLVGTDPASIYEVGSGSGALARLLVDAGHIVEATDISS